MVEVFDYHHMSKSPAVFDMVKLKWMNGEYLKAMDAEAFYQMALPWLEKSIVRPVDLRKIAKMVQTRIEVLPEIPEMVDFFQEVLPYEVSMYAHKKMKSTPETSLAVLEDVLPLLEAQEDYSNDALFACLSGYVKEKGYKTGYVMWPIRTALSGKQMTPAGATEIMDVIGKDESLRRIRQAVQKLREELPEIG